jgi:multicomponent Na+:H+ antiporter subunit D
MSKHLPVLIIAVPMLTAFILPIVSYLGYRVRNVFAFLAIISVIAMISSLVPDVAVNGGSILYVVGASDPTLFSPEGLTFPIRIVLKIDAFSLFMAMISSILALVAFLFSLKFIKEDGNRKNYYVILMLFMMTGMIGLEFTNDLFNFYVFLEILSISSAALVAYKTEERHPAYAGYKYILISAVASSFFLIGVGLLYAQYGSFNMDYIHSMMDQSLLDRIAMVFMIIPLAMKAGAIPMHMWVPDTYSEAPSPVTAMLVTASQASLYGLFRLCFSVFGNPVSEPEINYHVLGWIIITLGVLSMFVGVTMAIVQHDVKRLMAFHAVSQTGYMLMGVGVGIAVYTANDGGEAFDRYGRLAMTGGLFHIMNHAFYKGLLFLTAGVMYRRFGTRNLNLMMGLAHREKFVTAAFIIGALAIAGIPPFNGFASKLLIYQSVYLFNPLLAIIAMFVSVLTLASFVKVFYSAFLGPERSDLIANSEPVSMSMKAGMAILCLLVILFGLFPDLIINSVIKSAVSSLVGGI